MGMYDTVHVNCPKCFEPDSTQSKAGDCRLYDYTLYDAPPAVLGDTAGEEFTCKKCGCRYKVVVQMMAHTWPIDCSYQPDRYED